jgi:hypothetical protein
MRKEKLKTDKQWEELGLKNPKLEKDGYGWIERVEFDAPNGARVCINKGTCEVEPYILIKETKKAFRCTVKHVKFGEVSKDFDTRSEAISFGGDDEHEVTEVLVEV